MKFEVQNLEKDKVQVHVEVEEAEVENALNKAYKKVAQRVNVPGFRKGKVPRIILENRYGVEVLYDEAIDVLLPEAYEAALNETKLEPIDRPEVEVLTFEQGKPAVFQFTVQVPPEVDLGEYLGVEVEKVSFPVSDEDVNQQLKSLQEQHARLVDSTEEQVANQDYVTIDYEGFIDGEAFAGGQANDHSLQIGSGTFIPGFEEQLIGMSRDQEAEINVTFPEDYHSEDLAGKSAVFKVKIKDVKRKEVPELNDDFAAEVSEHATLEELRAETQNKLQEAAIERERNALEAAVVKAVVDNATVDIPDIMVDREVDDMVEELRYNLSRQGFPAEFAREYIDGRIDAIKADYRETAAERVKTRLVLQKVAETLQETVTDEDVDAKLQEMATLYKQDAEELRRVLTAQGNMQQLRDSLVTEKTVARLVAEAKQVEPQAVEEQTEADENTEQ
jgi:trigger factor